MFFLKTSPNPNLLFKHFRLCLFFILIPLFLFSLKVISLFFVSLFYIIFVTTCVFALRRFLLIRKNIFLEIESRQEQLNLLTSLYSQELKNQISTREKIDRYAELKNILDQINQSLSLDVITERLVKISFELIGKKTGVSLLFLFDPQTQTLNLKKSLKDNPELVIRAKHGDFFDWWVMRHTTPLLVEDARKDFRFDYEKLSEQGNRKISSLIAAPFLVENQFLGLLRLDHAQQNAFTQEDLRFLATICDLGSVAIEGSQLYQKALDLAIHDSLTSLYTKSYFLERLKEECARSTRKAQKLSLLMLDVDFFKNYNDNFGHTAGDIVLKTIAAQLMEFFKDKNALICRFGGEEFCVLLSQMDKHSAFKHAESFRELIKECKLCLRRQQTQVTISIGIAEFPTDAATVQEFIFKADSALYKAKNQGRDRAVIC